MCQQLEREGCVEAYNTGRGLDGCDFKDSFGIGDAAARRRQTVLGALFHCKHRHRGLFRNVEYRGGACFTVNIDIEGYLGMYNTGGGHVTCTRNHKAE